MSKLFGAVSELHYFTSKINVIGLQKIVWLTSVTYYLKDTYVFLCDSFATTWFVALRYLNYFTQGA